MQGNEACVEGALTAGLKFFAGYPITPSTEIAELLSLRLPRVGGKFIQMEDEIASMAAVIGASLAGLKAMTATSGPGFSLKQENIGYAAMAEVPCVVVDVQRLGPSTGLPTAPAQGDVMQARWGTHGDHPAIVLAPWSVGETFSLTVEAFNLSERFRTPVILLLDEVGAHMRETVMLPSAGEVEIVNRKRPTVPPGEYRPYAADDTGVPPLADFGEGYRFHVTGLVHDERGYPTNTAGETRRLLERLHWKVARHAAEICRVEMRFMEDAEIAIFAYGSTARSALAAVKECRSRGLKAGLVRPTTLWPFPEDVLASVARRVKLIVVAEMNLGQMTGEVRRAAGGAAAIVPVHQADGLLIEPETIAGAIREV